MNHRTFSPFTGNVFERSVPERLAQKAGNAGWNFDFSIGGNGGGDALRKPFAQSLWVRAAVRHIANPIAAVPVQFSSAPKGSARLRASSVRASALLSDPALEAFWQAPARNIGSFAEFIIASVGWRKLAGECFWLLGDDAVLPFPEVRESFPQLVMARPDRMRHVTKDGTLEGWEFTDGQGRRHFLTPEQVVHLRRWNPYCDFRGLGDYEAAAIDVETDHSASTFQKALADSNGDQGVYVVAKQGLPDDAQKKQIIAQLREKREMQRRGIFRPVFLTGDISVEDPQVRATDASFNDGRRMSAERIFIAFGVPPSMSAPAASYSIGSASDYYRLILDSCIPEGTELCGGIAAASSLLTGRKPVYAWLAWENHPVMQQVRKESLDSFEKLCNRGMPPKRAGEYLDLGLPRYDGDDIGMVPFSIAPLSDAGLSLEPGPEGGPNAEGGTGNAEQGEESDPVAEALKALRGGKRKAENGKLKATANDAKLWQAHMRARQEAIRTHRSAFTRTLIAARIEVLRKLDQWRTKSVVTKAAAADFLFDLTGFTDSLLANMRKAAEKTLKAAGEQLFVELGKNDPFTYPPARAVQFLKERENRLRDVAEEVFDQVKNVLEGGLETGASIDEIADAVRSEFNDMTKARATTISMTETAAAYGTARQEGMNQAGVQHKKWLTSGGDNVRASHAAANGQIVPVSEPFKIGSDHLMHPGDPNGSAAEVINCHCVSVAVALPKES